jgi:hypothetical protein
MLLKFQVILPEIYLHLEEIESGLVLAQDRAQRQALVLPALILLVSINPRITTTSFS